MKRRTPGETRAFVEGMRQVVSLLKRQDGDTPIREALPTIELSADLVAESVEQQLGAEPNAEGPT